MGSNNKKSFFLDVVILLLSNIRGKNPDNNGWTDRVWHDAPKLTTINNALHASLQQSED